MINRRGFLGSLIGGIATAAAVRTFPFRVFSFPTEIVPASSMVINSAFSSWLLAYQKLPDTPPRLTATLLDKFQNAGNEIPRMDLPRNIRKLFDGGHWGDDYCLGVHDSGCLYVTDIGTPTAPGFDPLSANLPADTRAANYREYVKKLNPLPKQIQEPYIPNPAINFSGGDLEWETRRRDDKERSERRADHQ